MQNLSRNSLVRLAALALLLATMTGFALAQTRSALVLEVDGAIGPATTDYLTRAFEEAASAEVEVIIIRMDTPGGLDAATRDINQAILASPIPVVTWVSPNGARAASAGTYILYASHIAAMAPATNLGAATPVQIGGGTSPAPGASDSPNDSGDSDSSDAPEESDGTKPANPFPTGDALVSKAVNDSAAYIRSLAELRGRNADWAERAVREAVSLTATEARENNVIDVVAPSLTALLAAIDGMTVDLNGEPRTLNTSSLEVVSQEPDWRSQLLSLITDPNVAYFLLLIGVYGLIFEGYNPGALVPGVIGAICLLMALYAFQVLPVNWAGVALIALGIALLIVEAFAPSFGILGIGGIVAMVFGSVMLFDMTAPGFEVSPWFIGSVAAVSGALFLLIINLAMRAWRRPQVSGRTELERAHGVVTKEVDPEGWAQVEGELWRVRSDQPIPAGAEVEVTQIDGLTLTVKPRH